MSNKSEQIKEKLEITKRPLNNTELVFVYLIYKSMISYFIKIILYKGKHNRETVVVYHECAQKVKRTQQIEFKNIDDALYQINRANIWIIASQLKHRIIR